MTTTDAPTYADDVTTVANSAVTLTTTHVVAPFVGHIADANAFLRPQVLPIFVDAATAVTDVTIPPVVIATVVAAIKATKM